MSGGRFGREPVPMTMTSPRTRRRSRPSRPVTAMVWGVEEAPVAFDHLDGVPLEGLIDQLQLALHHDPLVVHEIHHGDLVRDVDADSL